MTARYPVTLDVEGRRCVVLGGGELASVKAGGLLDAGADVTVIAAEICPAIEKLANIDLIRRAPRGGDLEGAFLAIDTTGDQSVNRVSWSEAERLGVILNVLDRPEQCHFAAPAIVRRGPMTIAVSTGGESPFLAASIRARLERVVGAEWGPFVSLVGRVRRRLRAQGVPPDRQAAVYRRLLRSGIRSQLAAGATASADFDAAAIAAGTDPPRPGRVTLVGAGPGDPGLLTLRGQEALLNADVVFHDALVEEALLAGAGPGAELVDVGKRAGRTNPEQGDITDRMIAAAGAGRDVVRLKGGDPFIFGRGGEEVAGLVAAGIDVAVVPGVSAAAAAPAAAGIPLTLRGVATSVAFTTARTGDDDTPSRLETLARAVDTLVVLMPLGDLEALAAQLAGALTSDRPAALVCSATLPSQLVVRGTLGSIAQAARSAGATAPATLIVGPVVALAAAHDVSPRRRSRSIAG